MSTLDDVVIALAALVEHEEPLAVVTVMDDDAAKRIASAWVMMPRLALRPPRAPMPDVDDLARLYDWTWSALPAWRTENARVRLFADLAERAGVAHAEVEAKVSKLRAARSIYVDGTIAGPLRRLLNSFVLSHLPRPSIVKAPTKPKTETEKK